MKKKKILLVDDLKEFACLIRVFLSKDYEVRIANDGLQALRILEGGFRPDAIVTDLIMPHLDGCQLIYRLNSNCTYNTIPVIVLTSVEIDRASELLKFVRFTSIVGKPFTSGELSKELIPLLKEVTYGYVIN